MSTAMDVTPPKRIVRYFVSYTRQDESVANRLLKELTKQFAASRNYEFRLWNDTQIRTGEGWQKEIQNAVEECDFGVLLVSPAFLATEYISKFNLSLLFQSGKLLVPVLLRRIDFHLHDLKGLESIQFFRFTAPRDTRDRSFEECMSSKHRQAFSQKLFTEIVRTLDGSFGTSRPSTEIAERVDQNERTESRAPAKDELRAKGIVGVYTEQTSMRDGEKVKDSLQIDQHVTLFAELIAARATRMPLSVGLFGDWGSGKSHFMRMLEQKIDELKNEGPEDWAKRLGHEPNNVPFQPGGIGPWCQRVVSIRFNAWSYLDANLWASLVTEIFEKLFAFLRPTPNALAQVEQLLVAATGATALAVEEVAVAEAQKIKAAGELESAVKTRESEQNAMDGMIHGLKALLPEVLPKAMQDQVKKSLGVEKAVETLSDLQTVVEQARRDAYSWRHLWGAFWKSEGRKWRLGWLALAAVGASILVPVIAMFWRSVQPSAQGIGVVVSQGLAAVAPIATWLAWFSRQANGTLRTLESWQRRAEAEQKKVLETPIVKSAQQKVAVAVAEETSARSRLDQARKSEELLREQARALLPERRLARFIEERAASTDYRGQLGLVSLARRDFEELSRFLRAAQEHRDAEIQLPERIILFVDDLDRCQPEKVVEVLQAVHLLLAFDLFAVVVGVDQRCLKRSLRGEMRGLLSTHSDLWRKEDRDSDVNGNEGANPQSQIDSSDETPATPLDYLEKIFQIPFHLPKMDATGFGMLMDRLSGPREKLAPAITQKLAVSVQGEEYLGDTGEDATEPLEEMQEIDDASLTSVSEPGFEPVIGIVPLEQWEREALKEYHTLISTPRAATRFLNTYRLIRAGLTDKEWKQLRGAGAGSAEVRVVMLLLAAAAGSPDVVRIWFSLLRKASTERWTQPTPANLRELQEWRSFARKRRAVGWKLRPSVPVATRREWIERVARFAF